MSVLQRFHATFSAWHNRRQGMGIARLVEENRVLEEPREAGGRRLHVKDDQRRRLAAKGKPLDPEVLRQIATIVTPETILGWHRRLIAAPFGHDHDERSHQWLENELPSGAPVPREGSVEVSALPGGLLKLDHRGAS